MIRLSDELAVTILQLLRDDRWQGLKENREAVEICRTLSEQLNTPGWASGLLDTVADLIGRVNSKNSISGDNLVMLRRALLSPRELAEFDKKLKSGVMCASCSKRIYNGEMATIEGHHIYCHQCRIPEHITCHTCDSNIPLNMQGKLARHKRTCRCKQPGYEPVKPVQEPEFDAPQPPAIGRGALAGHLRDAAAGVRRRARPMVAEIQQPEWLGIPRGPELAQPPDQPAVAPQPRWGNIAQVENPFVNGIMNDPLPEDGPFGIIDARVGNAAIAAVQADARMMPRVNQMEPMRMDADWFDIDIGAEEDR